MCLFMLYTCIHISWKILFPFCVENKNKIIEENFTICNSLAPFSVVCWFFLTIGSGQGWGWEGVYLPRSPQGPMQGHHWGVLPSDVAAVAEGAGQCSL